MKELSAPLCGRCGKIVYRLSSPNNDIFECLWCNTISKYTHDLTCSVCCSPLYMTYYGFNSIDICSNIHCPGFKINYKNHVVEVLYLDKRVVYIRNCKLLFMFDDTNDTVKNHLTQVMETYGRDKYQSNM